MKRIKVARHPNFKALAVLANHASKSIRGMVHCLTTTCSEGDIDATLETVNKLMQCGHIELLVLQHCLNEALTQIRKGNK